MIMISGPYIHISLVVANSAKLEQYGFGKALLSTTITKKKKARVSKPHRKPADVLNSNNTEYSSVARQGTAAPL